MYMNTPREDSVISPLYSCFELNFEFYQQADYSIYADGNGIRLFNQGTLALFSKLELTTGNGKHLEVVSHAQIVSLLYKLITGAKDSDDLSIRFDRDRNRRREELTNNKHINGKNHIRIMLKDVLYL